MALIPFYRVFLRPLAFESSAYQPSYEAASSHYLPVLEQCGGFDPFNRTVSPMRFDRNRNMDLHYYLDSITGAVECGLVDDKKWVAQLWASREDLDGFLEQLSGYDECFRIVDRWWHVVYVLTNSVDEEGLITCEEMAQALADAADEQVADEQQADA